MQDIFFIVIAITIILLIGASIYMLILCGSMCRTDDELKYEDERQMEYIKKYKKNKTKGDI